MKPQRFAGQRVVEDKKFGVQCLPAKGGQRGLRFWPELVHARLEPSAVSGVAEQGVANMRHVHADLMGPAGFQRATHERRRCQPGRKPTARVARRRLVARGGMAAVNVANHGHACAVMQFAADGALDAAGVGFRHAPHQRRIAPLQTAVGAMGRELPRQALVRRIGLGDDHQPAGILVEPMHDPRPSHAADARKAVTTMRDQCIDQGTRCVAGGWMHHEPCRLIDDDDATVLVDHLQRNGFALGRCRLRFRHAYDELLAQFDPEARALYHNATRAPHCPLADQVLQPRARQLRQRAREHHVEALARIDVLCDYNPGAKLGGHRYRVSPF